MYTYIYTDTGRTYWIFFNYYICMYTHGYMYIYIYIYIWCTSLWAQTSFLMFQLSSRMARVHQPLSTNPLPDVSAQFKDGKSAPAFEHKPTSWCFSSVQGWQECTSLWAQTHFLMFQLSSRMARVHQPLSKKQNLFWNVLVDHGITWTNTTYTYVCVCTNQIKFEALIRHYICILMFAE